jgi:hypothetical protein
MAVKNTLAFELVSTPDKAIQRIDRLLKLQ